MKTIILAAAASFMASAAAFVPVSQTIFSSTSSLSTIQQQASSSFENELGAQPPLGFWDPLGFLKDADAAKFDRLRYIELKHSRISMLAGGFEFEFVREWLYCQLSVVSNVKAYCFPDTLFASFFPSFSLRIILFSRRISRHGSWNSTSRPIGKC